MPAIPCPLSPPPSAAPAAAARCGERYAACWSRPRLMGTEGRPLGARGSRTRSGTARRLVAARFRDDPAAAQRGDGTRVFAMGDSGAGPQRGVFRKMPAFLPLAVMRSTEPKKHDSFKLQRPTLTSAWRPRGGNRVTTAITPQLARHPLRAGPGRERPPEIVFFSLGASDASAARFSTWSQPLTPAHAHVQVRLGGLDVVVQVVAELFDLRPPAVNGPWRAFGWSGVQTSFHLLPSKSATLNSAASLLAS